VLTVFRFFATSVPSDRAEAATASRSVLKRGTLSTGRFEATELTKGMRPPPAVRLSVMRLGRA